MCRYSAGGGYTRVWGLDGEEDRKERGSQGAAIKGARAYLGSWSQITWRLDPDLVAATPPATSSRSDRDNVCKNIELLLGTLRVP